MKIKLLTSLSGPDFSYAAGETVEIEDNTAKRLIDTGQAIKVNGRAKRETAAKGAPAPRE